MPTLIPWNGPERCPWKCGDWADVNGSRFVRMDSTREVDEPAWVGNHPCAPHLTDQQIDLLGLKVFRDDPPKRHWFVGVAEDPGDGTVIRVPEYLRGERFVCVPLDSLVPDWEEKIGGLLKEEC